MLTGVTPGGEAKVASQARSKNRNRQAGTAWYDPRDYYYPPRPQRRGLFGRRWFGGPYYDGPQGYYTPQAIIRRADIGGTQSNVLNSGGALSEGMHDVWMPRR